MRSCRPARSARSRCRSPSVMAGYLPEAATAEAFADGWYRTGDVGWLEPEGWVHLTDRSKEMIKVNGFQVAPAEIEAVLHGHPAVLDCAVFGLADERGRRGARRRRSQLDPAVPGGRRRARAASWPTRWPPTSSSATSSWSTPIPRLPSGKVLRRTLRDELVAAAPRASEGRLMDVRLSPEQQALRDSVAQVVERLGPPRPSGQLDDVERAAKLDAAVGGLRLARAADRPTDDGAPLASGGGGRHRGRGARPRAWPTRPSSGPTLAAELRRLAGAPAAVGRRDRRAGARPARPGLGGRRRGPPGAVAVDADGATAGARPAGRDGGHAARRGRARAPRSAATRPHPAVGRRRCGGRRRSRRPGARRADLDRVDRPRPRPDLRRPGRHHARCGRPRRRLRRRTAGSTARPIGSFQAVQHLLADALVLTEGSPQRRAPRRLGGRRAARRRRRWPPPRWPRPTAPAPPARSARPSSRSTAASATPGSAWPTSTCAGRCSRATCSAASGPASTGCSPTTGSGGPDGLR